MRNRIFGQFLTRYTVLKFVDFKISSLKDMIILIEGSEANLFNLILSIVAQNSIDRLRNTVDTLLDNTCCHTLKQSRNEQIFDT